MAARFATSPTAMFRHKRDHVESAAKEGARREARPFRNEIAPPREEAPRSETAPAASPPPVPTPPRPKPPPKAPPPPRPPRPGQRDRRSGPEVVRTVAREETALEMRLRGESMPAIADALGLAYSTTYELVDKALVRRAQENRDRAEALRQLELERIDRLQAALWGRALEPPLMAGEATPDPDDPNRTPPALDYQSQDKAVERITKLMERRAKLLGLDAPTEHKHQHSVAPRLLGAPPELEMVISRARAGDADAIRRLRAYVQTRELPPPGAEPVTFEAQGELVQPEGGPGGAAA